MTGNTAMLQPLNYRRLIGLMLLLVAAFGGLAYRLVDLQIVRHDELLAKAQGPFLPPRPNGPSR